MPEITPDTSVLKVATWNAVFSFGDERVHGALKVVDWLGLPLSSHLPLLAVVKH